MIGKIDHPDRKKVPRVWLCLSIWLEPYITIIVDFLGYMIWKSTQGEKKKVVTIKQNFRCLKMRRESKPIKCRLVSIPSNKSIINTMPYISINWKSVTT